MNVYITSDFEGHWPVPTAAVIVAQTEDDARAMFAEKLKEHGLNVLAFTLTRLPTDAPLVEILSDGNY